MKIDDWKKTVQRLQLILCLQNLGQKPDETKGLAIT